jgi:hypothetical protein
MLGPKREEVTGDWRKLHNEELHDLYSSDFKSAIKNMEDKLCTAHTRHRRKMCVKV